MVELFTNTVKSNCMNYTRLLVYVCRLQIDLHKHYATTLLELYICGPKIIVGLQIYRLDA